MINNWWSDSFDPLTILWAVKSKLMQSSQTQFDLLHLIWTWFLWLKLHSHDWTCPYTHIFIDADTRSSLSWTLRGIPGLHIFQVLLDSSSGCWHLKDSCLSIRRRLQTPYLLQNPCGLCKNSEQSRPFLISESTAARGPSTSCVTGIGNTENTIYISCFRR